MPTITIEPTRCGSRGQMYRVRYEGEVLIASTRIPALDACRALLARGISGTLEVWRVGKTYYDLSVDIEKGAKLTVLENAQQGPRLSRWAPYVQSSYSRDSGQPSAPIDGEPAL